MSPRGRLAALLATALALWLLRGALLPAERTAGRAAPARPPAAMPAGGRAGLGATGLADGYTAPAALPERSPFTGGGHDPFAAPRPPAPRQPVAIAVLPSPVAAPLPPAAPLLPRLPYRFIGLLSEKGQPPRVFLALGEQLIEARAGDTLQGGFQLQTISPRELTFLHLQQNLTVRLPVDGEPS